MYEKMKQYIIENQMLEPKQGILVALSGGADSMALLYLMKRWAKETSSPFFAVHVNHSIRGEEAMKDQHFVECVCKNEKIPLTVVCRDVPGYAKQYGLTMEEAARVVRYEVLKEEAERIHGKIAVAHHMEDQAETILYRMIRGTGIGGLTGMRPVTDNIIRPLLGFRKSEILAYLSKNQIEYVEDSTNQDVAYSRNRIRHMVMPQLHSINDKAVDHIALVGEYAASWSDYITKETQKAMTGMVDMDKEAYINVEAFLQLHPVIQSQVLRIVVRQVGKIEQDIYQEHIVQLMNLFEMENGKKVQLPFSLRGTKEYDRVHIFKGDDCCSFDAVVLPLEKEMELSLPWNLGRLTKSHIQQRIIAEIPKNPYTKTIDCDRINSVLLVRTRQPGDSICINEMGQRKKLSRYLMDEKVPQNEREKVIVVADGSHIVWVIGYRIGADYKVSDETTHTITLEIHR